MTAKRIQFRRSVRHAALLLAALTIPGAMAHAAAPGETLGLAGGTSAATATPTATAIPTEAPPTATNTRVPTFALVDNGGCAMAAPAAAAPLSLLATPLVLWLARGRRRRR